MFFYQLEQCQERMVELFKELEDPKNVDRVRYLEGKDPTPTELHEKIEGVTHFICLQLL